MSTPEILNVLHRTNSQFYGCDVKNRNVIVNIHYATPFILINTVDYIHEWWGSSYVKPKHKRAILAYWRDAMRNIVTHCQIKNPGFKLQFFSSKTNYFQNDLIKEFFEKHDQFNSLYFNALHQHLDCHFLEENTPKLKIIGLYKSLNMFELTGQYVEKLISTCNIKGSK